MFLGKLAVPCLSIYSAHMACNGVESWSHEHRELHLSAFELVPRPNSCLHQNPLTSITYHILSLQFNKMLLSVPKGLEVLFKFKL